MNMSSTPVAIRTDRTFATTESAWERPGPDGGPSLAQLDAAIAELSAHLDAATFRQLQLIAEFDRREGWALGGFVSCAHWLGVRIGIGEVAAREKVRVARALQHLPQISEALSRGQVSYSKVRALTRIATPENEEDLLGVARSAPASHVERVVREFRRAGRAGLELAQRQQEGRYLRTFTDADGMLVLEGRLPPEVGQLLVRALEGAQALLRQQPDDSAESSRSQVAPACETAAGQPDVSAESREAAGQPGVSAESSRPTRGTTLQQRADALGLVCERALSALGTAGRGEPYQVVVHCDAEVLMEPAAEGECCLEGGPALSGETARRLSCDAPVIALLERGGEVISVGRKSRRVSKALYRALRSRDRHCAFVGCARTGQEVHHVRHWADGGETSAGNTILLCKRCHWLLHEGGFTVRGEAPDGLLFFDPEGRELTRSCAPPELPADPVAALQAQHAAQGLAIDERTGIINWWGEPLDLDRAVTPLLRGRIDRR
jgi:hypothetical protein